MAGLAEETEIETPETDDEPQETDAKEPDEGAEAEADEGEKPEAESDEVDVYIGDAPPPAEEKEQAPEWVRELRKKSREDARRIRELEAKLAAQKEPAPAAPKLGPKPSLKDDDVDYDAEKFEAKLAEWHEAKRKVDEANAEALKRQDAMVAEHRARLEGYAKAKTALKVKDFDDAEEVVVGTLSIPQQDLLIKATDAPAVVVYALGKNPAKAKELAAITDPVKFVSAIAKLEAQVKVSNRKSPPPAEPTPSGTGRLSGTDSTLEKLRAKAEKTGDYSEVVAYKAKLSKKGK